MPPTIPVPHITPMSTTPPRGKQLRDLAKDAQDIFRRKKFNPIQELIDVYIEIKNYEKDLKAEVTEILQAKRLKFDVVKELANYASPKLRSVEHTGSIDTGITVVLGVTPKEVKTIEMRPDSSHKLNDKRNNPATSSDDDEDEG